MENQKKCIHCGDKIPNESQFCWSCGKEQTAPPPENENKEPVTELKEKPDRKALIIVSVVVVLLLSACCCIGVILSI